jgi:hypothetical protein
VNSLTFLILSGLNIPTSRNSHTFLDPVLGIGLALIFFIISDRLLSVCNQCAISPSLQTELFDHKNIFMSFSTNRKPSNHYINPSIFTHCRFQAIVATAVAETYLHQARIDQDNLDIEEGHRHIGRLIQKLSDCNELDLEIALNGNNNINSELRTLYHRELYSIVDELPDPDNLNLIELSCSADTFLEVLMGNIRNALISFQAWAQKCSQAKASRIINSLNRLKIDYKNNCDLIAGLENELTTIREEELSVKIRE